VFRLGVGCVVGQRIASRQICESFAERLDVLANQQVVGAMMATCLPAMTALNAARTATSVLPNPTSPANSRSIGISLSMSALTSVDRRQLVWGLVIRERVFEFALPRGVGRERGPLGLAARAAYNLTSPTAMSRTALRRTTLG